MNKKSNSNNTADTQYHSFVCEKCDNFYIINSDGNILQINANQKSTNYFQILFERPFRIKTNLHFFKHIRKFMDCSVFFAKKKSSLFVETQEINGAEKSKEDSFLKQFAF